MQPSTSQQALASLQDYQSKRQNPADVLKASETGLGVNASQDRLTGLRSAVSNTENLIRAVDPSVTGRTSGTLTTEAQRVKQVANERAPLDEAFRTQQGALGDETSNFNTLSGRARQDAQLKLQEQDSQQSYLKSIYDTLFGSEAAAEDKRRYEQNRQDQLNAQRASQASNDALARLFNQQNAAANKTAATQQAATINESDAAYLGRLKESSKGNPILYQQFITSLQNGNADAKRRYALAQQLGYAPRTVNGNVVNTTAKPGNVAMNINDLRF